VTNLVNIISFIKVVINIHIIGFLGEILFVKLAVFAHIIDFLSVLVLAGIHIPRTIKAMQSADYFNIVNIDNFMNASSNPAMHNCFQAPRPGCSNPREAIHF